MTGGLYSHTAEAGTLPKVLLPVQMMDRRARFTPQSAPTGPDGGPEGAASAGCAAGGQTKKGSTAKCFPFLLKAYYAVLLKRAAEIPIHHIYIVVSRECDFVEIEYDVVGTLGSQGYFSVICIS